MLRHSPGSGSERRLARVYRSLSPDDRATLLAFAEFLSQRSGTHAPGEQRSGAEADPPAPRSPRPLPRPDGERVVAAIKRLSVMYEMLDPGAMLNETSALMSAHLLQGRAAEEVIDELEALFARHYQDYCDRHASGRTGPSP